MKSLAYLVALALLSAQSFAFASDQSATTEAPTPAVPGDQGSNSAGQPTSVIEWLLQNVQEWEAVIIVPDLNP